MRAGGAMEPAGAAPFGTVCIAPEPLRERELRVGAALMREWGLTEAMIAERLDMPAKEVRRLLDAGVVGWGRGGSVTAKVEQG